MRFRETMEMGFCSGVFLEAWGVQRFCWLWARVGREETRWRGRGCYCSRVRWLGSIDGGLLLFLFFFIGGDGREEGE